MELLERADKLVRGCENYIYILGDQNLLPGPNVSTSSFVAAVRMRKLGINR